MFALADGDATRQRSLIVVNAVIGNLEVVSPSMDENAAAALGAVDETQSVDARRIAVVVARVRICTSGTGGTIRRGEQSAAGWERSFRAASPSIGRSGRNVHALAQNCYGSTFIGA